MSLSSASAIGDISFGVTLYIKDSSITLSAAFHYLVKCSIFQVLNVLSIYFCFLLFFYRWVRNIWIADATWENKLFSYAHNIKTKNKSFGTSQWSAFLQYRFQLRLEVQGKCWILMFFLFFFNKIYFLAFYIFQVAYNI